MSGHEHMMLMLGARDTGANTAHSASGRDGLGCTGEQGKKIKDENIKSIYHTVRSDGCSHLHLSWQANRTQLIAARTYSCMWPE